MLAVPILIAVALFLIWVLFKLSVHALSLFAGMAVAMLTWRSGGTLFPAALAGIAVALLIAATGPILFASARTPLGRAMVALLFAAPAAFTAYHAAHGIAAEVAGTGAWSGPTALIVAFLVGSVAWRRMTPSA